MRASDFAPSPTNVAKSWRAGASVEVLYGFVFRDGLQLHLCQVSGIDPVTNLSEVYLLRRRRQRIA